jgi:dihydroxyacetone kinase-like protein
MFEAAARSIIDNAQMLSELDMIGDADFGVNISSGFEKILQELSTLQNPDIGTILTRAGRVFIFDIGATIGGLMGRAFQEAGKELHGKREITAHHFVALLECMLETIKEIGRAQAGDKTLIDSLEPAYEAADKAAKSGITDVRRILEISASAAEQGANHTAEMVSKIGRASYIGGRSRGTIDPGAKFISLFLKAMTTI